MLSTKHVQESHWRRTWGWIVVIHSQVLLEQMKFYASLQAKFMLVTNLISPPIHELHIDGYNIMKQACTCYVSTIPSPHTPLEFETVCSEKKELSPTK